MPPYGRKRRPRLRLSEAQTLCLYTILCVLGLLMVMSGTAFVREGGILLALGGAVGALRLGILSRQKARRHQERLAELQARRRRRQERRERIAQEQQKQQEELAAKERVTTRNRERDAEQEQEQRRRTTERALHRAHWETRLLAEADRLAALSDSALRAEVSAHLAGQNLRQKPAAVDTDVLCFTDATGNVVELIAFAPSTRPVEEGDVRTLEAIRRDMSAPRADLVGRAGFTPEAVTAVRVLPITLTDMLVLARRLLPEESAVQEVL
jgi:hypothetical protein